MYADRNNSGTLVSPLRVTQVTSDLFCDKESFGGWRLSDFGDDVICDN